MSQAKHNDNPNAIFTVNSFQDLCSVERKSNCLVFSVSNAVEFACRNSA